MGELLFFHCRRFLLQQTKEISRTERRIRGEFGETRFFCERIFAEEVMSILKLP